MSYGMNFTGLDIETTGTDPNKKHRTIQIGIVLPDTTQIAYDVQPTGDMMIEADAMNVNGFTLERIGKALLDHEVDETIYKTLTLAGIKPGSLTPVGWNVGGFDMGFIKRDLPKCATFFSYRTMDLTGVAMMHELITKKPYRELKNEFHTRIVQMLGRNERHDALYDAEAALLALQLFQDLDWQGQNVEAFAVGTS